MTITAPTRITIEVHPADPSAGAAGAVVRVLPEPVVPHSSQDVPTPAPYDPGPCHCLDDEDCGADHDTD